MKNRLVSKIEADRYIQRITETGWKPILHCFPERRAMSNISLKPPTKES
jgi:hypothetical protein